MKKLLAAVILFVSGLLAVAVWHSPLASFGDVGAYVDNTEIAVFDGLCYPQNAAYRVEFAGDIGIMYSALDRIGARVVKVGAAGGRTVVYAYSTRVCADSIALDGGGRYNVMAATDGISVVIGTPILQGGY